MLRKRLQRGSFNINDFNGFLAKVAAYGTTNAKPKTNRQKKQKDRFLWQLENIGNARAKKPVT